MRNEENWRIKRLVIIIKTHVHAFTPPPPALLVAGFLNLRLSHLLSKSWRSNNQHTFLQGGICGKKLWGDKYKNWGKIDEKWRKKWGNIDFPSTIGVTIPLSPSPLQIQPCIFDLIASYVPPSSLRSSLQQDSLHRTWYPIRNGLQIFSFATLADWNSLPQHIRSSDSLSAFQGSLKTFSYKKPLPPKLSIACTKSPRFSTYALTMDSLQSLLCIFRITSFLLNYLDCMEGTPPMSSSENETGVELIIIITWWCHIKNKSQRVGVDSKGMRPETLSTAPPPVFKT